MDGKNRTYTIAAVLGTIAAACTIFGFLHDVFRDSSPQHQAAPTPQMGPMSPPMVSISHQPLPSLQSGPVSPAPVTVMQSATLVNLTGTWQEDGGPVVNINQDGTSVTLTIMQIPELAQFAAFMGQNPGPVVLYGFLQNGRLQVSNAQMQVTYQLVSGGNMLRGNVKMKNNLFGSADMPSILRRQ